MNTKGFRTPKDVILLVVRWYLRFKLSYRDLEEILEERGIRRDHTSLFRWVLRFTPVLVDLFRLKKKSCGGRWRMDESYVKINGQDRFLYRAVDREGNTVEFLLTSRRNRKAAQRFLEKAMEVHGEPTLINIDKSGVNTAGINDYNDYHGTDIEIRQCKYLNNIVEQDHRNVKGRIRPMRGFKSFRTAKVVLAGVETVHMIRKGQMKLRRDQCALSDAELFYSLAA